MPNNGYVKKLRIRDFLFASWLIFEYGLVDLGLDHDNWDTSSKVYSCWVVGIPSDNTAHTAPSVELPTLHKAYASTDLAKVDSLRQEKIREIRNKQRSQ